MSKLKVVELSGHKISLLELPPPHMLFLASAMSSEEDANPMTAMAYMGGLAALVVKAVDGEPVVLDGKMPRTLDQLAHVGRGFIMVLYEVVDDYGDMMAIFQGIVDNYNGESKSMNPT